MNLKKLSFVFEESAESHLPGFYRKIRYDSDQLINFVKNDLNPYKLQQKD